MAHKQFIKTSEARILIYLNGVNNRFRYIRKIASKLQIDYGYTIQILNEMFDKGWVRKEVMPTKTYYFLTNKTPMKQATKKVTGGKDAKK